LQKRKVKIKKFFQSHNFLLSDYISIITFKKL